MAISIAAGLSTAPIATPIEHRRQGIRSFRIDRIRELQVLDETFERDPNFDPRAYLETTFQHEMGNTPMAIAIGFSAKSAPFIRERRWHSSQAIEEHPDGSLTLRLVTGGLNDLKRWVLGYGKEVRVLEPPELVALVKAEIAGMVQHYDLSGESR